MITYLNKFCSKKFLEFEEPFGEEYTLGTTYDDYLNGLWIQITPELNSFRELYPNATIKQILDLDFEEASKRELEVAKMLKLKEIERYDASKNVNGFLINNTFGGWFTAALRSNFRASIDSAKLLGVDELSFFVGDNLLKLSPTLAEQMLAQIQLYADLCFIITKQHQLNVKNLETMEEIQNYNYTSSYPQMLNFSIEL